MKAVRTFSINREKLDETCLKLFEVAIELSSREYLTRMQTLLEERLVEERKEAQDE